MESRPRPELQRALSGATGFLRWRAFVESADETWAIRVSSTVGFGVRQEGETWTLGERRQSCSNEDGGGVGGEARARWREQARESLDSFHFLVLNMASDISSMRNGDGFLILIYNSIVEVDTERSHPIRVIFIYL